MDFMNKLKIPEKYRDSLMLSLTHRSMLNFDNGLSSDKLILYNQIGHNVMDAILIKFISQNYNFSLNGITTIVGANKNDSLYIIYKRLNLNKLSIFNESADLNKLKVIQDLTYQFFGFLYLELSFEFAYKVFTSVYTTEDVTFISDYMSVLNVFSKGKKLEFKEIEAGVVANEPYFKYNLTFEGKQVCATASSKKKAKKMCAELYCKKYINEKFIFNALGLYKKNNKKCKSKDISKSSLFKIRKIASKWNFEEQDLCDALTNKFLYNEYNFKDCRHLLTIGGFYELVIIDKIVFKLYNSYSANVQKSISCYISNNEILFEKIIKTMELNDLFILQEKLSSSTSIDILYKDAVRILTYYAFEKKNTLFFEMYKRVIHSIVQEIDPYLLFPINKVCEMYDQMKINKPNITIEKNDSKEYHEYTATLPIILKNKTVYYHGIGNNKNLAINIAYEKFWTYLYNSICEIFITINPNKYNDFFDFMSEHMDWFARYLVKINHPIHKSYIQNKYKTFINFFQVFINNVESYDDGNLVLRIKNILYKKIITIKIENNDVLIYSILEYILTNNIDATILTRKQLNEIVALSRNTWKNMLKMDGMLIRHISMPDEELQMISILQSPESINYIDSPTNAVIQHVYQKERFSEIELRPKIIEGLTSIKKQEIEKFIINFKNENENIFLLDQYCFDSYLRAIIKSYNIKKFYIACGFVYSSGIQLLKEEIDSLIENNADIKILAGNLQHYFSNNQSIQMDKETAKQLNILIKKGVKLKTITNCFYHGKIYILVCNKYTFVIIGSTNMSRNAFRFNNEIDNMFIYDKEENAHMQHFINLWNSATTINELDEELFKEVIADTEGERLMTISLDNIQEKIQNIDDKDLQNRLLTWLKYKPSNIYDKIDVAGRDYVAIEYNEKEMIVLESLFPGNSYFVFYNLEIKKLLNIIKGKTKTEIFKLSGMEKRGYHIREELNLENKIKSYFLI